MRPKFPIMTSRLISRLHAPFGSFSGYHTSSCLNANFVRDNFRMSLGLADKQNKTPELREYPDYSFTNGRPTPVTPAQLKRIKRQQELAAIAVQHLKEIKFIEERFQQKENEKIAERQRRVDSKLKPKGENLLRTKNL